MKVFPKPMTLAILLPLICLTGCGGPSQDDVRQAVYVSMMKPMAELAGQRSDSMSADDEAALKSIHLVSCDKQGSDTYSCNVTGLVSSDVASTVTLVKGDSGWILGSK